jgi:hypothetical protein
MVVRKSPGRRTARASTECRGGNRRSKTHPGEAAHGMEIMATGPPLRCHISIAGSVRLIERFSGPGACDCKQFRPAFAQICVQRSRRHGDE